MLPSGTISGVRTFFDYLPGKEAGNPEGFGHLSFKREIPAKAGCIRVPDPRCPQVNPPVGVKINRDPVAKPQV